jgi:hypothetical protein
MQPELNQEIQDSIVQRIVQRKRYFGMTLMDLPWGEELDEYGLSVSYRIPSIRSEGRNRCGCGSSSDGEDGCGEFHCY